MLCGRIISVSLLLVCLGWTTSGRAQTPYQKHTGRQSGTSLADRLALLSSPFQKEKSHGTQAGRTGSQAATSQTARRSSQESGKRQPASTQSKREPASEKSHQNTKQKSNRSMLGKMNADNFLPSGFFSREMRVTPQPIRKLPSQQTDHSRQQKRTANAKRPRSNPKQARTITGTPVARSLPSARRSPDMESRRGELEAALAELLEPREVLTAEVDATDRAATDSLTVTPPRATNSEPIPGFLSNLEQSKSPTPTLQESPNDQATRVETISGMASTSGASGRSSSALRNAPLDIRRALQGKTPQDPLFPQPRVVPAPPEQVVAREQTEKRPEPNLGGNQLRATTAPSIPNVAKSTSAGNRDSLEKSPAKANGDEGLLAEDHADECLLFSYKQPMIVSHVEGPQRILVGRPASYRITLLNQGDTAADSMIVTVRIPAWAEVVDATSSRGIVQKAGLAGTAGADTTDDNSLQWRIQQLEPNGSQSLHLRLVPHRGRPMQLGVSWVLSPVGSAVVVEVQEPKLQMAISGPDDVLFGKPQRYQLTLSNPGTGIAEEVKIQLVPPGGNVSSATTHEIGSLQPGESQSIDLELTAREAGDLQVLAMASAAGNLRTETTKQLFCRKPELELDWRGPDSKYAGMEATYFFRLRNSGTAPLEPLQLKLQLPAGVKYVEASEGESFDDQKRHITWQLTGLNPREEKFVQVRCQLDQAGPCVMQLSARTVTGELQDEKTIETEVLVLADLKLEVNDPKGPVPVGDSAIYEIRVTNRGTSQAQGVNIVGLFSDGIDPVSVEGAQYSIRDGRVSFQTIKSLPAGRDIVLRILAKAAQPGMHLFRAEVVCQELDIKLSSEETTRFFQDKFRWDEGDTPYMAERKAVSAPVIRR